MSQFAFLKPEFEAVYGHAQRAEVLALSDPRGSCFYTRLALETAVKWLYQHDGTLRTPYDDALSALIHEGTFRTLVGNALVTKARLIKDFGNRAVHDTRAISENTATVALRELYDFSYWLVRTYAKGAKPQPGMQFSAEALPKTQLVEAKTLAGLQAIAAAYESKAKAHEEAEAARIQTQQQRDELEAQIKALRAQIAQTKKANQAVPDDHDYNEAQTRDAFIDLLLREAGWPLDQPRDREFPVTGMPNNTGEGFIDYVLWGDDGRPLALIEAKRTKRDPRVGQQQAKLYADCLEAMYGTPTATSTGSGMTPTIRRARCRAS
jgi:type I restriction enzyme R subunit